MFQPLMPQSSH